MREQKILWGIIFVSVLLHIFTLSYFLLEKDADEKAQEEPYFEVVAEVGDEVITMDELVDRLIQDYGDSVLEEMINRRLVFSEAEKLNLTIPEEEIQREIAHLQQDYRTEEEFYRAIEEQIGITEEELRKEISYYLLLEEMATRDIVITEEEMRAYYAQNQDLFIIPTRMHLHLIQVDTEEEALQVIEEIEQGSSFEAVAAERSTDLVNASSGGDMGFVTSNDLFISPEILQTAEVIPIDQLSEPIEVNDGYVVIKVTERLMGREQPFEEVRAKIRRELALQQIDGLSIFLERLRETYDVKNVLRN